MDQRTVVRLDVVEHPLTLGDALTRWMRAVPLLVLSGLTTVAGVLANVAAGTVIVVTGRPSVRLRTFAVYVVRVRVRTFSTFWLLRPGVPPLPNGGLADDGADPHTEVSVGVAAASASRFDPFIRLLLAVPWVAVGLPMAIVLDVLYPAFLVIRGCRGWSPDAAARLAGVEQWVAEVFLYVFFVTAHRPPFVPRLASR